MKEASKRPTGLDFSGWKKVKEGKDSTEFQHADGHVMHVKHSALSPALQKQLGKLPVKMSAGGRLPAPGSTVETGDDLDTTSPSDFLPSGNSPVASINARVNDAVSGGEQAQVPVPGDPGYGGPPEGPAPAPGGHGIMDVMGDITGRNQHPASAPEPDPMLSTAGIAGETQLKGLGQQQAANTAEANAAGAAGTASGVLQEQAAGQQKDFAQHLSDSLDTANQQVQAISQEIQSNQIKPESLFHQPTLWGKIGAGLGLILGGIGGGLSGMENPVLKQLQQEVHNDLEVQEKNQDNRANLIGHLSQTMGHYAGAKSIAAASMLAATQQKLQSIASQSQDPILHARAQGLNSILETEKGQALQQGAYLNALGKASSQGALGPQAATLQYLRMTNPKQAQDYANRLGTTSGLDAYSLSAAGEDAKNYSRGPDGKYYNMLNKETKEKYDDKIATTMPLLQSLSNLSKYDGILSRVPYTSANQEAKAAVDDFATKALSAQGIKRLSELGVNISKEMAGNPTQLRTYFAGPAIRAHMRDSILQGLESERRQMMPGNAGSQLRRR